MSVPMRATPKAAVPPHPFDSEWYAHLDGQTHGLYSGHQIRRMVEQRQIVESDFVCPDGGSAWVQAKNDPILGTLFQNWDNTKPGARSVIGTSKGRIKAALMVLILVTLGWLVWPYYALYELASALREGDTAGLENRIAWDSIRQGLRDDLNSISLQKLSTNSSDAGIAAILAPGIVNQIVEGYVTPTAVANLIRAGRHSAAAKDAATASQDIIASELPHLSLRQVKYAFFSGGPFAFKVEVIPDNERSKQNPLTSTFRWSRDTPVTLLFRWSGNWKLTRIMLSADAMDPVQRDVPSKNQNPGGVAAKDQNTGGERRALNDRETASMAGSIKALVLESALEATNAQSSTAYRTIDVVRICDPIQHGAILVYQNKLRGISESEQISTIQKQATNSIERMYRNMIGVAYSTSYSSPTEFGEAIYGACVVSLK
jgi:hypothetical protein